MSESSSLKGKRVVVTRAAHQAASLQRLLRDQDAIPVSYPCLDIAPVQDSSALDAQLRELHQFDTLIITSSNTAIALADRLGQLGIQPDWPRLRIAALGSVTGEAVRRSFGRPADFLPDALSTRALARSLSLKPGERIFLPQSALAGLKAAEILRERGAEVIVQVAYRTINGVGGADVPALIARREIDALTFASPSAVGFFRQRCPDPAALDLPAVGLGPATANKLNESGFREIITPESPSLSLMVAALSTHFRVNS